MSHEALPIRERPVMSAVLGSWTDGIHCFQKESSRLDSKFLHNVENQQNVHQQDVKPKTDLSLWKKMLIALHIPLCPFSYCPLAPFQHLHSLVTSDLIPMSHELIRSNLWSSWTPAEFWRNNTDHT